MSAGGGFVWDESGVPAVDLSSYQYYFVKSTGNDTWNLCTNTSVVYGGPKGVLQNDPTSVMAATIRLMGRTKLVAGGAVAAGDRITCTTGGTAVTAATTGQFMIGWANTASTASGQIIEAFLGASCTWVLSTA